jgi:predicted RNase H-like HicB family nuclease
MYNVLVIVENGESNLSAFTPDLPGACIATGATREQLERKMYEALALHIKGTLEDKLDIPEPSIAVYLSVPVSIPGEELRMYRFLALIRQDEIGWMARCIDLTDWDYSASEIVVNGATREEAEQKMYKVLQAQTAAMQAAGEEIPQYQTTAVYMLVPQPADMRVLQAAA